MRDIILIYGVSSGAIVGLSTVLGITLLDDGSFTAWLGYLIMLLALTMVFLAIKQYRDRVLGGAIGFGRACTVGLGVAVVAGLVYVVTWEAYLAATGYAFMDDYAQALLAQEAAQGADAERLAALEADIETMRRRYDNPLFRIIITFLEIFPVGVLVTLVSAALLRRGAPAGA